MEKICEAIMRGQSFLTLNRIGYIADLLDVPLGMVLFEINDTPLEKEYVQI